MQGVKSFHMPQELHYEPGTHVWARVEAATGRLVLGIDAMGLAAIGDLAFLTLKEPGTCVSRGQSIGTLEAAKMVGDLIAPVSGTLCLRNDEVLRNPMLVNQDPYGKGWLVVLEPTDWSTESALLISGETIPGWVEAEARRYQS
jgi:glycine cleavage system H protein